ncbi:Cyclic nucleotide-binding protein [Pseudocohnilembus persalinus]|uniref:Cyclic nucleotide-binding protein n=1 Tax=Pseudocohnilembus persalinus TaxID=266149 RepID=A0A0V0QF38_PSEPJ|nr:Cyclic nucleotide-binding protein [Pseudocohnilembus persalinus]|eukprot:KRX00825.1 Cyclic nucleotide-binding protein [Pseudocohnilembus persalinus]
MSTKLPNSPQNLKKFQQDRQIQFKENEKLDNKIKLIPYKLENNPQSVKNLEDQDQNLSGSILSPDQNTINQSKTGMKQFSELTPKINSTQKNIYFNQEKNGLSNNYHQKDIQIQKENVKNYTIDQLNIENQQIPKQYNYQISFIQEQKQLYKQLQLQSNLQNKTDKNNSLHLHKFNSTSNNEDIYLDNSVTYNTHFVACIFHYIGQFELEHIDTYKNSWLLTNNIIDQTKNELYITSIYYSLITMVTVGYGDITPVTTLERIFCMIVTVITCGIFGYAVNAIGTIFKEIEKNKQDLKDRKHNIQQYLTARNINQKLQLQIINQVEHKTILEQSGHYNKAKAILNQLPKDLYNEVKKDFIGKILKKNTFFRTNFSDQFLENLSHLFHEKLYMPDEPLFLQDEEQNDKLYIIANGQVELTVSKQKQNDQNSENEENKSLDQQIFISQYSNTSNYNAIGIQKKISQEDQKLFKIQCLQSQKNLQEYQYKNSNKQSFSYSNDIYLDPQSLLEFDQEENQEIVSQTNYLEENNYQDLDIFSPFKINQSPYNPQNENKKEENYPQINHCLESSKEIPTTKSKKASKQKIKQHILNQQKKQKIFENKTQYSINLDQSFEDDFIDNLKKEESIPYSSVILPNKQLKKTHTNQNQEADQENNKKELQKIEELVQPNFQNQNQQWQYQQAQKCSQQFIDSQNQVPKIQNKISSPDMDSTINTIYTLQKQTSLDLKLIDKIKKQVSTPQNKVAKISISIVTQTLKYDYQQQ